MAAAVSRAFRLPTWTRGGRASHAQFPPSSALRVTASVSVPSQVLHQNIVHRALRPMKNLLKLAESHESDCFLMKAEDARRDWNYLWDLSISPSRATWETIRGQRATQNEICSCQINIWKYSLAFLPLFPYQEKSFPGTEPTSGLGEMYCACREGHHETPLCLALSRGREPQGPGPSCPPACSPWGLGQVNPFSGLSWDFSSSEKCHPGYKSLDFYLSCLATATNNLMWNLPP